MDMEDASILDIFDVNSMGMDLSDLIQFAESDIKLDPTANDSPVGSPLAPSEFTESVPPTPGLLDNSDFEDVFLDFDTEVDSQLQQLLYIAKKVDGVGLSSAAETQTDTGSSTSSMSPDLEGLSTSTDFEVPSEHVQKLTGKSKSSAKAARSPYARANKTKTMSDNSLIDLSVKDLNRLVQGMPRDQVSQLKSRRRTLKNRGYAANSREKRQHHKSQLEDINHSLLEEMEELREERDRYKRERDQLLQLLSKQKK